MNAFVGGTRTPAGTRVRNAALVAFSFAIALCAAEYGLRLAARLESTPGLRTFNLYMSNADRRYYLAGNPMFRRSRDPDLGWEAVPGVYRDGQVRVNDVGFRGPVIPEAKPPGRRRIAVLGDSEVFGEFLAERETLAARVEMELNARGESTEVLNFGVVGYNTEQEFALLQKKVMRYSPDTVLVYYVFNDPELPARTLHFQGSGLLRGSYLYNLVLWVTAMKGEQPSVPFHGSFVDYYRRLHDSPYFDRVRGLVEEMGAFCAQRGIRFVLVIAPEIIEVPDLDSGYPYDAIHEKLQALASPAVEVIDPRPALAPEWDRANPKAFWVAEYDPHKNARANATIARAIAEALLRPPG